MAGGTQLFEGVHLTDGDMRFCRKSSKSRGFLEVPLAAQEFIQRGGNFLEKLCGTIDLSCSNKYYLKF